MNDNVINDVGDIVPAAAATGLDTTPPQLDEVEAASIAKSAAYGEAGPVKYVSEGEALPPTDTLFDGERNPAIFPKAPQPALRSQLAQATVVPTYDQIANTDVINRRAVELTPQNANQVTHIYVNAVENVVFINPRCYNAAYSIEHEDYDPTAGGAIFDQRFDAAAAASADKLGKIVRERARAVVAMKDAILAQTNDTNPLYTMYRAEAYDLLTSYFTLVYRAVIASRNGRLVLTNLDSWLPQQQTARDVLTRMYTADFRMRLGLELGRLEEALVGKYYEPAALAGYLKYWMIGYATSQKGATRLVIPKHAQSRGAFYDGDNYSVDLGTSTGHVLSSLFIPAELLTYPRRQLTDAIIQRWQNALLQRVNDLTLALRSAAVSEVQAMLVPFNRYPRLDTLMQEVTCSTYAASSDLVAQAVRSNADVNLVYCSSWVPGGGFPMFRLTTAGMANKEGLPSDPGTYQQGYIYRIGATPAALDIRAKLPTAASTAVALEYHYANQTAHSGNPMLGAALNGQAVQAFHNVIRAPECGVNGLRKPSDGFVGYGASDIVKGSFVWEGSGEENFSVSVTSHTAAAAFSPDGKGTTFADIPCHLAHSAYTVLQGGRYTYAQLDYTVIDIQIEEHWNYVWSNLSSADACMVSTPGFYAFDGEQTRYLGAQVSAGTLQELADTMKAPVNTLALGDDSAYLDSCVGHLFVIGNLTTTNECVYMRDSALTSVVAPAGDRLTISTLMDMAYVLTVTGVPYSGVSGSVAYDGVMRDLNDNGYLATAIRNGQRVFGLWNPGAWNFNTVGFTGVSTDSGYSASPGMVPGAQYGDFGVDYRLDGVKGSLTFGRALANVQ